MGNTSSKDGLYRINNISIKDLQQVGRKLQIKGYEQLSDDK